MSAAATLAQLEASGPVRFEFTPAGARSLVCGVWASVGDGGIIWRWSVFAPTSDAPHGRGGTCTSLLFAMQAATLAARELGGE